MLNLIYAGQVSPLGEESALATDSCPSSSLSASWVKDKTQQASLSHTLVHRLLLLRDFRQRLGQAQATS